MKSAKLKVGDFVITKGYYEANDGGSGEYEIVDNSSLSDDGGSIHDLSNGLKAKLIIKNGEVEKGNKATDYQPAYEEFALKSDLDSFINNLTTEQLTVLKAKLDSLP